jgi:hypothetical protein
MTKSSGAIEADCGPLRIPRVRQRVPVFTAACVVLGVAAHSAAGGSTPGAGVVLVMVVAVAMTSASLECREQGLPSIVLAVALAQLGVHVALLAGHDHAASRVGENRPALFIAHAWPVVVLAWWLRRGEAAAWRATAQVWPHLVRLPCILFSSKVSLRDGPTRLRRARFCGAPGLVLPVRGPPR